MASKPRPAHPAAEAALRGHALAKPEATEHFPWGERAIKVKGKVFLFLSAQVDQLSLSTKLPASSAMALLLPFAEPTGYGLGKAGWVTARFEPDESPPLEVLCAWIDESYQAVAPAKLAALARADAPPPPAKPAPAARPAKPTARPAKPAQAARTAKPTKPAKPAQAARTARRPAAAPSSQLAKRSPAKPTPRAAKPTARSAKPTARSAKPTARRPAAKPAKPTHAARRATHKPATRARRAGRAGP
jgi:predicted DNA-binding protein (MmcQ/YjbR family)